MILKLVDVYLKITASKRKQLRKLTPRKDWSNKYFLILLSLLDMITWSLVSWIPLMFNSVALTSVSSFNWCDANKIIDRIFWLTDISFPRQANLFWSNCYFPEKEKAICSHPCPGGRIDHIFRIIHPSWDWGLPFDCKTLLIKVFAQWGLKRVFPDTLAILLTVVPEARPDQLKDNDKGREKDTKDRNTCHVSIDFRAICEPLGKISTLLIIVNSRSWQQLLLGSGQHLQLLLHV